MKFRHQTSIFTLFALLHISCAYRILFVFPTTSPSHMILGKALAKEMAKRGHDVTMVSAFPLDKPMKNYRDIYLDDLIPKTQADFNASNFFTTDFSLSFIVKKFAMEIFKYENQMSYITLQNKDVQKVLNEKFDLIVLELFFSDALAALGAHFGAPMIGFSTAGIQFTNEPLVGNPAMYSTVPNLLTGYSPKMTFLQRLHNSLLTYTFSLVYENILLYPQRKVKEIFFPNTPSFDECRRNFSLIIANSDVSFAPVRPLLPSIIEVGGFHIQNPKPIPKDLKEQMDNATQGVVYFSMGSNLKSKDMPKEKVQMLLNAFKRLPQLVLWKWEDENLADKPENVIVKKWFPQSDLLAHPNIQLFITHGGLGSVIESFSRAVPLIVMPVFADQYTNAKKAVNEGYGAMIDFKTMDTETVYETVNSVLSDKRYKAKMEEKQRILMDKPIKPIDKAAYWMEYVARNKGASHLRYAGMDLNFIQYFCLDVLAVVVTVIVVFLYVVYTVLRLLKRLLCGRSKKEKIQ